MSEVESIPSRAGRSASPAAWQAGCIITCGLALLPIIYVGSFAFLVADEEFGWGFTSDVDEPTGRALNVFYRPLLWLCEKFLSL